MTSRAEELIREVLALPTPEKVQVIEAVVHDLAGIRQAVAEPPLSLIGLFADEPEAVDDMLATVTPLEGIAADLAGRIYADLLRAGEDVGVADTMIAAIAIHRGLPLATGNVSDHVRVQRAGYPLLIENWRDPLS